MTKADAGGGGGGGEEKRLVDPPSSSSCISDSSLAGLTAGGVLGVGGCDWCGVTCSLLGGCRGGRNASWGGGR